MTPYYLKSPSSFFMPKSSCFQDARSVVCVYLQLNVLDLLIILAVFPIYVPESYIIHCISWDLTWGERFPTKTDPFWNI